MLSILSVLYETCCTGFRPKEQQIINRIFQDVEDLADYEIDRLLKHLELKRKTKLNLLLLVN
jgi:hypothetical protein